MRDAMCPHLPLLVREDAQVTARPRPAEQDEFRRAVFRKISHRVCLIDDAFQQSAGTSQASSLMADRGQRYSIPCGCIPDVFIVLAVKRAEPLRCLENHAKAPLRYFYSCLMFGLGFHPLWIVEAAVLAVWGLAWFATAEVS